MIRTGIVRKVDDLGRIIVPVELRRVLDVSVGDPMQFFVDQKSIIVQRYEPGCVFCGAIEDTIPFKGKKVCRRCAAAAVPGHGTPPTAD